MNFNGYRDTDKHKTRWIESMMFLELCVELYGQQIKEGRYFVHEHPWRASSWNLECIQRTRHQVNVDANECQKKCSEYKITPATSMVQKNKISIILGCQKRPH